jgi:hypothetical protein
MSPRFPCRSPAGKLRCNRSRRLRQYSATDRSSWLWATCSLMAIFCSDVISSARACDSFFLSSGVSSATLQVLVPMLAWLPGP